MTAQEKGRGTTRPSGGHRAGCRRADASVRVEPCISMRRPQQPTLLRKWRFLPGVAYSQHLLHNYPHDFLPQRRRARRLGLRRGRAAAPPGPPSRPRRRLGRRGPGGRPAARLPLPRPAVRLRRARLLLGRGGPGEGRRRAVLRPAPRPGGRDRPPGPGRGRAGGRPLGRLPAARPWCLPGLVRGRAPLPRPARRLALRPARAAPRGAAGGHPGGRARLLPDGGPAGPGPTGRRRAGRGRRDRGRRQVGAVGRRPVAHRRQPVRPGQRERRALQGGQPPAHPGDRAGAGPGGWGVGDRDLHPAPGPGQPGAAGHLLRHPGPVGRRRGAGRVLRGRLRRRAVRRPARAGHRLAGHPGRHHHQPGPGGGNGRPAGRQGGGRRGHRQPGQGGRRPGRAVRQPRPRPARDGRPRPRPPRTLTSTVPVDRRLGVTAAAGFGAAGVSCGLKQSAAPDLALVVGDPGTVATGVFTTNQVVAAPVVWSRDRLAASADARVVVLNSGNANACTGPAGEAAVLATVERAATELGCRPEQVLVCSTGVIGVPLDAARVSDGVAKAAAALDRSGGLAAAEAILTTDTRVKQAGTRVAGGATVGGMAKGAAMLAPALAPPQATMLAVLTTDAVADPADLEEALATAAAATFNRITVDGAQSTNDTVLLLASGASGARPDPGDLAAAVAAVCSDLAGQMLADAEGGTKVVSVQVGGAGPVEAALAVARRVADSPLVKTAVYGGDPNWGRVLQAAGTAGVRFDPGLARLEVAGGPGAAGIDPPDGPLERVLLVSHGRPTGADASAAMAAREIELRLHLGGSGPWAEVRTSDLTPEYVRLNSEYTT